MGFISSVVSPFASRLLENWASSLFRFVMSRHRASAAGAAATAAGTAGATRDQRKLRDLLLLGLHLGDEGFQVRERLCELLLLIGEDLVERRNLVLVRINRVLEGIVGQRKAAGRGIGDLL